MSTTTFTALTIAPDTTASLTCESCAHPTAGHDLIAVRYCRATAAGALVRTCICKAGQN